MKEMVRYIEAVWNDGNCRLRCQAATTAEANISGNDMFTNEVIY